MRDVAGIRTSERVLLADLAAPLGGITSLLLAAGLVALRGDRWRPAILVVLLVPVAAAVLLGGARAGLVSALVTSLAFNFFHLTPYGVLKLGPELAFLLVIILPVLVAIETRRRRRLRVKVVDHPDHNAHRAPR